LIWLKYKKILISRHLIKNILLINLRIYGKMACLSPKNLIKIMRVKRRDSIKLNIGCGKVKLPGWVNIDIEPGADLVLDVRHKLPFDDNSVDYIFNEHFFEHLSFEEGLKTLRDFHRCLKVGGVLRIAMPNLDDLIQKYNTDWKKQDWLYQPEYEFIETRGMMINIALRWWGHKYSYNEEDLRRHMVKAGFREVIKCEKARSEHAELCGLETTRLDPELILEAVKY